jgi:hypothetical protein
MKVGKKLNGYATERAKYAWNEVERTVGRSVKQAWEMLIGGDNFA